MESRSENKLLEAKFDWRKTKKGHNNNKVVPLIECVRCSQQENKVSINIELKCEAPSTYLISLGGPSRKN